jgi:hypothetical protein
MTAALGLNRHKGDPRVRSIVLTTLILTLFAVDGSFASCEAKSARTVPCAFPDGWNGADHQRQMEGIPPDAHHQCLVNGLGQVVDSRGRRTS